MRRRRRHLIRRNAQKLRRVFPSAGENVEGERARGEEDVEPEALGQLGYETIDIMLYWLLIQQLLTEALVAAFRFAMLRTEF